MIYCASGPAGAFGEAIAALRTPLSEMSVPQGLAEVTDAEPVADLLQGIRDPRDLHRGVVPSSWRYARRLGTLRLGPDLRFVDLMDAATLQYIREAFAPLALALGWREVDYGALFGPDRTFTHEIAGHFFEQIRENGQPSFAGIRYASRLNLDWECWAIFDHRITYAERQTSVINFDTPGLLDAARLFGLTVQSAEGTFMHP